ncbi:AraC family transcriptional regulator [Pseudonocardia sp.]|uniref:AraC family transcriptional regulator n=1 Tax=Pseudonocardia sp. TaxID=60912 RepID=UPI003D0F8F03
MGESVRAWRPAVPGIAEVFHAHFTEHAYPVHTHEAWTLLLVDDGAVRYDLDRHANAASPTQVTLLPPHVPHDGRAATAHGFRKRVLYLDADVLGADLAGAAVDRPAVADPLLRRRVHQLHEVLRTPGEDLEAQSRLALLGERLREHLRGLPATEPRPDRGVARRLRELIDARIADGIGLDEAGRLIGASPTHLVRAFTREHGVAPHRYLTGRRVDLARRLLLDGLPPGEVAVAAGFYDQAHLGRHFRRLVGITPARYARG